MNNIFITNLTKADSYEILYISKNIQSIFTCSWNKEQFLQEINSDNCIFYVAKLDNEIIGFIAIQLVINEIEILNIAVDINYRKQKVGTTLLEYITNYYQQNSYNLILLEVNVNNISAINLYKKLNFNIINTRKDYYLNTINNTKEDAYIMTKKI